MARLPRQPSRPPVTPPIPSPPASGRLDAAGSGLNQNVLAEEQNEGPLAPKLRKRKRKKAPKRGAFDFMSR